MIFFRSIFEWDELCCPEGGVFLALEDMEALACPLPFFPLSLKLLPQSIDCLLFDLVGDGHVRRKVLMFLASNLRKPCNRPIINLLELIAIRFRIDKTNPMRETANILEPNLKSLKFLKLLPEYLLNLIKTSRLDKRKSNIDMRWPSIEGGIMFLPDLLD